MPCISWMSFQDISYDHFGNFNDEYTDFSNMLLIISSFYVVKWESSVSGSSMWRMIESAPVLTHHLVNKDSANRSRQNGGYIFFNGIMYTLRSAGN